MEKAIKDRPFVERALLFIGLCGSNPSASYLEQLEHYVEQALDDVYTTGLINGHQGVINEETKGW